MAFKNKEEVSLLREKTQEKIIKNSLELFARFGFEKTSIRMISQKAEISLGLMYNYFESKDDLLKAIFSRSVKEIEKSFTAGAYASPYEKLEKLIHHVFDATYANREFWKLFYGLRMQPSVMQKLSDEISALTVSLNNQFIEHFKITGAANPEAEAKIFIGMIDGISIHYVMKPGTYPIEEVKALLIKKYCK
jgi:AcrR family transcriptional regulator